MSTHNQIGRICVIAMVLALVLTGVCLALGQPAAGGTEMGYASFFSTDRVHTIDIQMEDWDGFLAGCENEEYVLCDVVLDGETCANVAIRAKGNTSLSSVSAMGSDRYSFKIEFDHYDSASTYHGLDKLSLNNLIQDNTMMKDYLAYQLMGDFGVASPLCSYVFVTVNGEDWGLYLAVEAVEESFLQRNYGSGYGDLYKPDTTANGGGRGNGQNFNPEDLNLPEMSEVPEDFAGTDLPERSQQREQSGRQGLPEMTEGQRPGEAGGEMQAPGGNREGGMSGMGSSDVKLQYIDDDPDSYANIFDNAKTPVTAADKTRLIAALKTLSGEDPSGAVDADQVLRYFVVHTFLCNDDSYTGTLVHNYYLYEQDGVLSMIPWDYNLAFGGFQSGDAEGTVNDPIDSPVSGDVSDRPMAAWIFSDEDFTEEYHALYQEFIDTLCGDALTAEIDRVYGLIAPYVERDPTKFCTVEAFETAVTALKTFCTLRTESVSGQLDGTIPSTQAGQAADSSALVDASGLSLSDMGNTSAGGFGRDQTSPDRKTDWQGDESSDSPVLPFARPENTGPGT